MQQSENSYLTSPATDVSIRYLVAAGDKFLVSTGVSRQSIIIPSSFSSSGFIHQKQPPAHVTFAHTFSAASALTFAQAEGYDVAITFSKDLSVLKSASEKKEGTSKDSGFDKLIPDLRDWNGGRGTDIGSWIKVAGDFQKAIGYSTIFWPNFVEHEGYILREGFSESALRKYCKECSCKRTVESAMNTLRIADLHYSGCHDATPERMIYIGTVLKEIYQCKLALLFPGRSIEVVFEDAYNEDVSSFRLTFYQK